MIRNWFTHKTFALAGLILALVMFVASMTGVGRLQDTDSIAERTADRVEKRLRTLDKHIANALQTPAEGLMLPDRIPDDMVSQHTEIKSPVPPVLRYGSRFLFSLACVWLPHFFGIFPLQYQFLKHHP